MELMLFWKGVKNWAPTNLANIGVLKRKDKVEQVYLPI